MMKKFEFPSISDVRLNDGVFAIRQKKALTSTIPSAIKKAEESGRISAFDLVNYHGPR